MLLARFRSNHVCFITFSLLYKLLLRYTNYCYAIQVTVTLYKLLLCYTSYCYAITNLVFYTSYCYVIQVTATLYKLLLRYLSYCYAITNSVSYTSYCYAITNLGYEFANFFIAGLFFATVSNIGK